MAWLLARQNPTFSSFSITRTDGQCSPQVLDRSVARGVVDDDDLGAQIARAVVDDALEALVEQVDGVPVHDHDGEVGGGHGHFQSIEVSLISGVINRGLTGAPVGRGPEDVEGPVLLPDEVDAVALGRVHRPPGGRVGRRGQHGLVARVDVDLDQRPAGRGEPDERVQLGRASGRASRCGGCRRSSCRPATRSGSMS